MDELLVEDIKNAYYEYVSKIPTGCLIISKSLRIEQYEQAFSDINDLAEGLQWLIQIEGLMQQSQHTINSRIFEANELMNEINTSLELKDYVLLADLFEYEIKPLFESATEWVFIEV